MLCRCWTKHIGMLWEWGQSINTFYGNLMRTKKKKWKTANLQEFLQIWNNSCKILKIVMSEHDSTFIWVKSSFCIDYCEWCLLASFLSATEGKVSHMPLHYSRARNFHLMQSWINFKFTQTGYLVASEHQKLSFETSWCLSTQILPSKNSVIFAKLACSELTLDLCSQHRYSSQAGLQQQQSSSAVFKTSHVQTFSNCE